MAGTNWTNNELGQESQIWARKHREHVKHKTQGNEVWHYAPLRKARPRPIHHPMERISRAAPIPEAMVDPGTRAAMADLGTQAAIADQGTPWTMADQGTR